MALDTKDLVAIEEIVSRQIETKVPAIIDERIPAIVEAKLASIKTDIAELKRDVSEMKKDVAILATLNQLEDIKKDPRLRVLYKTDIS